MNDASVNCLDRAVDFVNQLPADQRAKSELVLLDDNRGGSEGATGHVVVRQGDAIVDPQSGAQYASTAEYLAANPQYREAGAVSGDDAQRIFSTAPRSRERAAAIADSGVPATLAGKQLADPAGGYSQAQADADARTLHEAVDGWGTDEDAVFGTLKGKTSDQIEMIRQSYRKQFDASLDDDLRGDFVGDEEIDKALLGTPSVKTTEQIEQEYTVAPDPGGIVDWPSADFLPQTKVTAREAEMLNELVASPWGLGAGVANVLAVRSAKEAAEEEALKRFPEQGNSNGHADAFRHAYVNALLTKQFGEGWAKAFMTAHEGNPESAEISVAMDLYNNEVGRRIAVENPDASAEELATLVEQAVNDGKTVVIGQDLHLHYSNTIPRDAAAPKNDQLPPGDRAPGKEVEAPY